MTSVYLAVGILAFIAWQITGNDAWVIEFFGAPAALLMVALAGLELWLSIQVLRHFAADDLLRTGWTLIACSAGCQFVGFLFSQVLGVHSQLNPFTAASGDSWIPLARQIGLTIGGTFRFALLAGGLWFAVKAYRRAGLGSRLTLPDSAVLLAFLIYLVRNVVDVVRAMHAGKQPDVWEVLGWPVDPLLFVLIIEGILLFRSARQLGTGRIGLCWRAMSAGVFLTAIGDVAMWAANYGYLPWPWSALTWYVWLPAAAAFARAPAFQLEVIRDAAGERSPFASEYLSSS